MPQVESSACATDMRLCVSKPTSCLQLCRPHYSMSIGSTIVTPCLSAGLVFVHCVYTKLSAMLVTLQREHWQMLGFRVQSLYRLCAYMYCVQTCDCLSQSKPALPSILWKQTYQLCMLHTYTLNEDSCWWSLCAKCMYIRPCQLYTRCTSQMSQNGQLLTGFHARSTHVAVSVTALFATLACLCALSNVDGSICWL